MSSLSSSSSEISFDGGHFSILLDDPMQDLFNYIELDLNFEGTVGADLQLQSLWQSGRNKRARLIDPKCLRLTSHYIQTRLNFLTWLELRSGRLLVLGNGAYWHGLDRCAISGPWGSATSIRISTCETRTPGQFRRVSANKSYHKFI